MNICTTTGNVAAPSAAPNAARSASPIADTSTLNCSAKAATTDSASDSGR